VLHFTSEILLAQNKKMMKNAKKSQKNKDIYQGNSSSSSFQFLVLTSNIPHSSSAVKMNDPVMVTSAGTSQRLSSSSGSQRSSSSSNGSKKVPFDSQIKLYMVGDSG
jgi:hypothetical protein